MSKNNSTQHSDLTSLKSVGKAIAKDLHILGIYFVEELEDKDAFKLYEELCQVTGEKHDHCVIDVFLCAIAQAKKPLISNEKKDWWYWTQYRKKVYNQICGSN